MSHIIEKSSRIQIEDFVAFKIVKVHDTGDILGNPLYFIGYAGRWFFVTDEEFNKIKEKFSL